MPAGGSAASKNDQQRHDECQHNSLSLDGRSEFQPLDDAVHRRDTANIHERRNELRCDIRVYGITDTS
jgi:hypothetical protein